MNSILIAVGVIVALIVLLKIWNKYSLRYNHEILLNSRCKNCAEFLGAVALNNAVRELEKEKEQLKREAKIGSVKLHNMKLICPNCGIENFERELYKANRESRKNK